MSVDTRWPDMWVIAPMEGTAWRLKCGGCDLEASASSKDEIFAIGQNHSERCG